MDGYQYHFVGMHLFWWMFWVILIISFFWFTTPVRRKTAQRYRENPFAILQRRYAAGEITTEEYEERRTRIERDSGDIKLQPLSSVPGDHDVPA